MRSQGHWECHRRLAGGITAACTGHTEEDAHGIPTMHEWLSSRRRDSCHSDPLRIEAGKNASINEQVSVNICITGTKWQSIARAGPSAVARLLPLTTT